MLVGEIVGAVQATVDPDVTAGSGGRQVLRLLDRRRGRAGQQTPDPIARPERAQDQGPAAEGDQAGHDDDEGSHEPG